jgi:hypothetical protein
MIGQPAQGGQPLGDSAMLVEVIGSGEQYLISNGYRHRIVKSDTVTVSSLALESEPWTTVGAAFVAALPDGEPLGPIKVGGLGTLSKAVPNKPKTLTGQLFVVRVSGGAAQYYVATKDHLVPISELQFDIQRAFPATKVAYRGKRPYAIPLDQLDVGAIDRSGPDVDEGKAPRIRPAFVAPRNGLGTVCATFTPGGRLPTVAFDPAMPARDRMTMTPKRGKNGTALADRILITPGTAAVVMAMQSGQAPTGTISVVTDMGRAYPLADPKVLEALGYGAVQPVVVPASLIARVPQGPGLDPRLAIQPAP